MRLEDTETAGQAPGHQFQEFVVVLDDQHGILRSGGVGRRERGQGFPGVGEGMRGGRIDLRFGVGLPQDGEIDGEGGSHALLALAADVPVVQPDEFPGQ